MTHPGGYGHAATTPRIGTTTGTRPKAGSALPATTTDDWSLDPDDVDTGSSAGVVDDLDPDLACRDCGRDCGAAL